MRFAVLDYIPLKPQITRLVLVYLDLGTNVSPAKWNVCVRIGYIDYT